MPGTFQEQLQTLINDSKEHSGVTKKRLAEMLDIHRQTLYMAVGEKGRIGMGTLVKMLELSGYSVERQADILLAWYADRGETNLFTRVLLDWWIAKTSKWSRRRASEHIVEFSRFYGEHVKKKTT